ncbi:hypothetical protein OIV83_004589 [Microbotryomycetes sp. JL201]|nr:hypothetical protein OIV83_004589 [Microbotryomycetes sp. JL201]
MPDNANPVVHKPGSTFKTARRHARALRLSEENEDDDAGEWSTAAASGTSSEEQQQQEINQDEVFDHDQEWILAQCPG